MPRIVCKMCHSTGGSRQRPCPQCRGQGWLALGKPLPQPPQPPQFGISPHNFRQVGKPRKPIIVQDRIR
jgi:hypothetical protein